MPFPFISLSQKSAFETYCQKLSSEQQNKSTTLKEEISRIFNDLANKEEIKVGDKTLKCSSLNEKDIIALRSLATNYFQGLGDKTVDLGVNFSENVSKIEEKIACAKGQFESIKKEINDHKPIDSKTLEEIEKKTPILEEEARLINEKRNKTNKTIKTQFAIECTAIGVGVGLILASAVFAALFPIGLVIGLVLANVGYALLRFWTSRKNDQAIEMSRILTNKSDLIQTHKASIQFATTHDFKNYKTFFEKIPESKRGKEPINSAKFLLFATKMYRDFNEKKPFRNTDQKNWDYWNAIYYHSISSEFKKPGGENTLDYMEWSYLNSKPNKTEQEAIRLKAINPIVKGIENI